MKIVMTLLVRDEEDILDAHLQFHLRQGVDSFIVTDNRSVDGTRDILRRYEDEGVAQVIEEGDDTYAQAEWVTRMARIAHAEHGADWVIPSDADEFWWPKAGDLKRSLGSLSPGAGILAVPRVNFLPRPVEEGALFDRMIVREVRSVNALGEPLPPKICHRGHPDAVVTQGNHSVEAPGLELERDREPLIIFHFPMRTYRQFENKIALGGAAYQRNERLPAGVGATWRALYQRYRAGTLREHFEECVLGETEIEAGIREGGLIRDRRLRDFVRSREGAKEEVRA